MNDTPKSAKSTTAIDKASARFTDEERAAMKHATAAAATCPSIGGKNVTPHTLRHSTVTHSVDTPAGDSRQLSTAGKARGKPGAAKVARRVVCGLRRG